MIQYFQYTIPGMVMAIFQQLSRSGNIASDFVEIEKLVFFIIILAVSSEVVYRGVVFRTLADYVSTPAAVFGSCMLFAFICPVLNFPIAIILGGASAILYYRTRNLLASITANAIFTVGGGALTLYHGLMHG
jgi:membrane protease YdiL (CAAX protease family)